MIIIFFNTKVPKKERKKERKKEKKMELMDGVHVKNFFPENVISPPPKKKKKKKTKRKKNKIK